MKSEKWIWSLLALALGGAAHGSEPVSIATGVYAWKDSPVETTAGGSNRSIVKGRATDFEMMEISATTLEIGGGVAEGCHTNFEEMIVVKHGRLEISIHGKVNTVGRGSVAVIMPGDVHSYTNVAAGETTFYVLRYQSKTPVDSERGKTSGGSFVMDWDEVKSIPRSDGKGETRSFFTRSTAMGKRLELHSTVLEPSQSSHAPHRHRAEELVIILDAEVEMYLGPEVKDGKIKKATEGDIIYLVSNEYHAISNIGQSPALYFAFQFE